MVFQVFHRKIRFQVYWVGWMSILSMSTIAIPAIAQTDSSTNPAVLIGQVNVPSDVGLPSELYHDVEGTVESLNGDQVVLQLNDGQEKTYKIPEGVQRRYRMAPGSRIVLTVRNNDNDVVDVGLPGQQALDQ